MLAISLQYFSRSNFYINVNFSRIWIEIIDKMINDNIYTHATCKGKELKTKCRMHKLYNYLKIVKIANRYSVGWNHNLWRGHDTTRWMRAILLYSKDYKFLLYSPHHSVANGAQPPPHGRRQRVAVASLDFHTWYKYSR